VASVINLPWSVAPECIALAAPSVHSTRWSQLLAENRDFCLPHLHSTLPSEYCYDVQYRKTRMVCRPEMKKNEDIFIRFDRIHKRDRRTDRQTSHDGCIASRGKNAPNASKDLDIPLTDFPAVFSVWYREIIPQKLETFSINKFVLLPCCICWCLSESYLCEPPSHPWKSSETRSFELFYCSPFAIFREDLVKIGSAVLDISPAKKIK